MPRIRTEHNQHHLIKRWAEQKDWSALDELSSYKNKKTASSFKKPDVLYHGSPYKIKKSKAIKPKGPTYFGLQKRLQRPTIHASSKFNEVKAYAKESDTGGINKKRYGKKIQPKVFAKKGYVYEIHTQHRKGWMKQYHGSGVTTEKSHWMSHHAQGFDKRHTVRFKGKLPITRNEAIGVGAGVVAGAYAYHHRDDIKRKLGKFAHTHNHFRTSVAHHI